MSEPPSPDCSVLGGDEVTTNVFHPPTTVSRSPLRDLGKKLCSAFEKALGPSKPLVTGSMSEPVQVFLRLRPISSGEDTAIEVREDGISVRATAPAPLNQRKEFRDPRDYSFTSVMDETTSQVSMYEATTSGIVKSFHDEAKSGLVFTYGVTNAGKSHTVLGNKEDPGLLPRAIERICENLDFEQEVI